MDDDINFIQGYMEFNRGTEIPPVFAFWCGVAGVSCALGRNVWIDMGAFTIFPNFYIVLVASSGKQRKSTAIEQIERIIKELQPAPNLIEQKITPEALIDSLKKVDNTDPGKLFKESSVGFVICDEMANFLNKQTYESGLGALLIPLFDCKRNYGYKTKGGGVQNVQNACFGILGGSTVDWIRSGIPEDAVGGGLTSRIIFVFTDTLTDPVPLPTFSPAKRELLGSLIKALQRIASLTGEFKIEAGALEYYCNAYKQYRASSPHWEIPTLSGYASRRFVHFFKLAMVFSVCESTDMVIKLRHCEAAADALTLVEATLPQVMSLITTSEQGSNLALVFQSVFKKGRLGITRSDLLRTVSHRMNAFELNQHIDMLLQSNRICQVGVAQAIVYIANEVT